MCQKFTPSPWGSCGRLQGHDENAAFSKRPSIKQRPHTRRARWRLGEAVRFVCAGAAQMCKTQKYKHDKHMRAVNTSSVTNNCGEHVESNHHRSCYLPDLAQACLLRDSLAAFLLRRFAGLPSGRTADSFAGLPSGRIAGRFTFSTTSAICAICAILF